MRNCGTWERTNFLHFNTQTSGWLNNHQILTTCTDFHRCICKQVVCPNGYVGIVGDLPNGDQFGGGLTKTATSVDACGADCSGTSGCLSFEWSPSEKKCFRNQLQTPTQGAHKDFLFCSKVISGYTYSHAGYWDGYVSLGSANSDNDCAGLCNANVGCQAFSRQIASASPTCWGYGTGNVWEGDKGNKTTWIRNVDHDGQNTIEA